MRKIAYLGVAATALLLAVAPSVAQEAAEPADETAAGEPAAVEDTAATADAAAAAGLGEPMVCKRGKTERHINIVAPGSEGRVCEMHYAKPTEGVESRMLWYATSDKSFCSQKANELMAQLTSSGWSCTNPDGTPVSVESTETEMEAPAEPEAPADSEAPAEEPADAPEGEQPN